METSEKSNKTLKNITKSDKLVKKKSHKVKNQ